MIRNCLRAALCCVLAMSTGALAADDDSIALSVDASKAGAKIDRNIFGQFAEHLGRGLYEGVWVGPDSKIPNTRGIRNDVVAALKAIKVPNVRWPGGCFADEYHWRNGIGPRDQRPPTLESQLGRRHRAEHFRHARVHGLRAAGGRRRLPLHQRGIRHAGRVRRLAGVPHDSAAHRAGERTRGQWSPGTVSGRHAGHRQRELGLRWIDDARRVRQPPQGLRALCAQLQHRAAHAPHRRRSRWRGHGIYRGGDEGLEEQDLGLGHRGPVIAFVHRGQVAAGVQGDRLRRERIRHHPQVHAEHGVAGEHAQRGHGQVRSRKEDRAGRGRVGRVARADARQPGRIPRAAEQPARRAGRGAEPQHLRAPRRARAGGQHRADGQRAAGDDLHAQREDGPDAHLPRLPHVRAVPGCDAGSGAVRSGDLQVRRHRAAARGCHRGARSGRQVVAGADQPRPESRRQHRSHARRQAGHARAGPDAGGARGSTA